MPGMEKLEEELVSRALVARHSFIKRQVIRSFSYSFILYDNKQNIYHGSLLHQHTLSRVTYWSKVGLV